MYVRQCRRPNLSPLDILVKTENSLITYVIGDGDANATLPVATFRALRAFTALRVFFDRVDVSLRARLLLHFAGTHIDDSVGSAYGLSLYARWRT